MTKRNPEAGLAAPIHPGEILYFEFMEPLGLSQNRLAVALGVPPRRINEIVNGKRAITADTAVRLAAYFGTTEQFWMNLQSQFELESVHATTRKSILKDIRPHDQTRMQGATVPLARRKVV